MNHPTSHNAVLEAWPKTLAASRSRPAIVSCTGETLRTFADIDLESFFLEPLVSSFPSRAAIGIQIGNSESWPAVLLAIFRRNLVPLPIGSHTEGQELADALEVCGAAALIMASEEGLTIQRRRGSVIRHDCDFLKLTSGTTNTPRAVRFRAHQLVADCTNICETMGITSDDLNFGVVPFSHSYGFSNLLTPLLCRGVPLVASEDRMPRAMLSHLECTGATVFPGMPVFFDKLAALENITPLSDLRLCISAGAPLPSLVAKTFFHRFDQKIHTFYGSSECGGIGYDASSEPRFECGFAGQPMKGVEITPEPGEGAQRIVVRGPAVADGYFPSADEETLRGGRFIPGDLIRWSECGMFIEGRASDIINIAGRKLNPAEIEGRISAFPGVRQVVVFGVPSALRGEEPIACVAGEGLDRTALQRFCQMQLSQWQIPRDFWIVPEIPANERGKISRRALAEDYASRME